jgi:hypothetical protein
LYEDELKEIRVTSIIYTVYTVGCQSSSFMSVLQCDMLDVTLSQKYHVNMGPVLTGYGPMVSYHNFGVCTCVSHGACKDLNELFGFKKIHRAKAGTLTSYCSCLCISPCIMLISTYGAIQNTLIQFSLFNGKTTQTFPLFPRRILSTQFLYKLKMFSIHVSHKTFS